MCVSIYLASLSLVLSNSFKKSEGEGGGEGEGERESAHVCSLSAVHVWRSEDNCLESVLSFYLYLGSGAQT